ncbi:Amino-acid acetyltransferase [Planctomycetes bacterium Poly30]|uniref:Amino-acid acetyltransferase n=1 Tax=Saltatorellus ferox TaxID=2528018 RepID=A0A518EYQ2_9BACT|nr:Amino-acid acetyltransferase [Planctomycetes bacterium Poly30]
MTESAPTIELKRATIAHVEPIMDLVNGLAAKGVMLPRSPASIVEKLRDFVVAYVDGEFAGCGALAVIWTDIAEVRSIAVDPKFQKLGLGRDIALRLIDDARDLGIARVMAFTYVLGFFEKLGFEVVPHESLPHKVFTDCLNCPKFHKCDEIAVVKVLKVSTEAPRLSNVALPTPGQPFRIS